MTQKVIDFPPEMKQQLKLMSAQVVAIDEVVKKMAEQRDTLVQGMGVLATSSETIGKTTIFCHDLKTTPEVNLDHLRDVLLSNGLDPESELEQVSIPKKYNTQKLLEFLTEEEFDLAPFVETKTVVVDKVVERMHALNIPADAVIDHVFSVKKTLRKIPDVLAFKPKFACEGAAINEHIIASALAGMGMRAEVVAPIARDLTGVVDQTEEEESSESQLIL